jgi:hypothetical protein
MRSLWVNFHDVPEAVALDGLLTAHRARLEAACPSGHLQNGLWPVTAQQLTAYIADAEAIILKALHDGGTRPLWGVLIQIDCSHLKVSGEVKTESVVPPLDLTRIQYQLANSEFEHVKMQFDVEGSTRVSLSVEASKLISLKVEGLGYLICHETEIRSLVIRGKCNTVMISRSTIKEHLIFYAASVAEVRLISTTIEGSFEAENSSFGEVDFGLSAVKTRLVVNDCRFMRPPNVHDSPLPSDAVFSRSIFLDQALRERFKAQLSPRSERSYTSAAERYRALRLAMKKAGSQDEELRFFALEMRCRRQQGQVTGIERVVSWLYDVVSVYGSSASRAMLVFILWNAAFCALFVCVFEGGPFLQSLNIPTGFGTVFGVSSTNPAAIDNTMAAFRGHEVLALTLQNALNPFAALGGSPAVRVNNLSIAVLCIIQSIGSVASGALALLALRLKFQRSGGG